VSENCAETRPSFPLTRAGRGHRPLFMVLVRLPGEPLVRKLVKLKAIALYYLKLGSQNGNPW
jgi:hypothetical protein